MWTKPILCLWCSWFIFILYAFISQTFMLFQDSVHVLVCWLFTFLWMNFQTKKLQKNHSIFAFCFEIVLACSFVVQEQFIALTYLVSLLGMEVNYIFPRISLLIWFWEVNKIRKYFRLHFHQTMVHSGYQKHWNKSKTYFTFTFGCLRSRTDFERS